MGSFFAYSLQSAICLAVFYLFFKVLLSRETFHRFNRIALLSIFGLSLILPIAFTATDAVATPEIDSVFAIATNEYIPYEVETAYERTNIEAGKNHLDLLLLLYIFGCIICLIYTSISITYIIRVICKGKCISVDNGIRTLISDNNTQSFSWMNYIILSKNDYNEAGLTIIAHERAHISLHHTYDLIIAQLCIIMQWFNPAAWLLYQELQNIHEYEADENVLRKGIDARQYQLLLIKKAVGTRLYSMANSFNQSNLKKRITMMLQKKSSSWARLKYTYVLPLAAIAVVAFAHPEISQQFEEISSAKISHFASETSTNEVKNLAEASTPAMLHSPHETEGFSREDSIYTSFEIDNPPKFPGGTKALFDYINNNMKNTKVILSEFAHGAFIINTDGSVSDVRARHPSGTELEQEAIRVIKTLPKFTPGEHNGKKVRVHYHITCPTVDPEDPTAYITAEVMPEFPGGEAALLQYINNNIKYPEAAIEYKIEGRVPCMFTINIDGSVSNITAIRPVDPELDKEAVRVITGLPKFKPGTIDGKPARVRYTVPVRFRLPATD